MIYCCTPDKKMLSFDTINSFNRFAYPLLKQNKLLEETHLEDVLNTYGLYGTEYLIKKGEVNVKKEDIYADDTRAIRLFKLKGVEIFFNHKTNNKLMFTLIERYMANLGYNLIVTH